MSLADYRVYTAYVATTGLRCRCVEAAVLANRGQSAAQADKYVEDLLVAGDFQIRSTARVVHDLRHRSRPSHQVLDSRDCCT